MLDPLIYLIRANRRHCVGYLLPSPKRHQAAVELFRLGSQTGEEVTVDLISSLESLGDGDRLQSLQKSRGIKCSPEHMPPWRRLHSL